MSTIQPRKLVNGDPVGSASSRKKSSFYYDSFKQNLALKAEDDHQKQKKF